MDVTGTNQLNELIGEEDEDTLEGKYLTFPLGNEEYGLEIRHVTEIVGIQHITEMPDMPTYVKGVINLRGKVIPVMDVRMRFGLDPKQYDDHTCIVVVNIQSIAVGLVVDTVSEVISIAGNRIEPPPTLRRGDTSRYIQGLGKVDETVKILLNIEQLLYDQELQQITSAAS